MKILPFMLLSAALLASASASAFAQDAPALPAARAATENWLKLVDKEEYSAAWNVSADSVRKDLPKFAYTMLMSATHAPLGDFKSRKFKGTSVKKAAADKPGEESVSFEYESQYEKNARVRETVTAVHEKDGTWRVSGYGINNDDKR